jgi:NitT/TauT family transport system permease protein
MLNRDHAQIAKLSLVGDPDEDLPKGLMSTTAPNLQGRELSLSNSSDPFIPECEAKRKVRPLLERVTREQMIALSLGCVSILTIFAVWYLGTKFRVELYIRFRNVPTPYAVLQQAIQVGLSNKFLVNVFYSVKRIMFGFVIAIAVGVPLGLLIGRYKRVAALAE